MIGYIILFILITFSVFFFRNRVLHYCLLGFMFVTVALNTQSPDFNAYIYWYEHASELTSYEFLFNKLNIISYSIGLSYLQFRCFIVILSLIIFEKSLRVINSDSNLGIALVILCPYLCFASGLRSAIPYSLGLLAFSYLLKNDRKSSLNFIVCIILASLIHYSFIFYSFFLLIRKRKLKYKTYILLLLGEVFLIILYSCGLLAKLISIHIHSDKVLNWISPSGVERPSFKAFIFVALCFYCIIKTYHFLLRKNQKHKKEIKTIILYKDYDIYHTILNFSLYYIPFLYINMNFERLFFVPFSFIALIMANFANSSFKKFQLLLVSLFFMIIVGYFIDGQIFYQILTNNLLW